MMRLMCRVMIGCLALLPFASTVHAQTDQEKPSLSGAGGASGIGYFPPNTWGVVSASVNNPTDVEQQLLVTFNFDSSLTLQFAADVWIPPRSRRSVWLPMRTHGFEIEEHRAVTLPMRVELIDERGPAVLAEARGMISAPRDRWITGMIADSDDSDDDALSVALAMRRAVGYSRRMIYPHESALPTMPAGWEGLNALVLAKHSPTLDAAQTQALRQWLLSGGKLWVMIDEVDPQALASILGETWSLSVVDRVPLSMVRVDPAAGLAKPVATLAVTDDLAIALDGRRLATLPVDERARVRVMEGVKKELDQILDPIDDPAARVVLIRITGGVPGDIADDVVNAVRSTSGIDVVERDHEQPVDLVRVLARDFEVTHTAAGWPAALRKPVGKGWLMVTTLGARGWMEERLLAKENMDGSEAKDAKDRTIMMVGQVAHRPLRDLADWFHLDRRVQPLPPQAFDAYASEQIGYAIVGRGTVFWVLMLFAGALTVAGFWLAHSGQLEHLGYVGAAIALVATLVLIIIGQANRSSVPTTVAQAQFVQIAPDQQQAISSGLIAVYNSGDLSDSAVSAVSTPSSTTLGGDAGGLILPASWDQDPTRQVRMVWTDFDRWHWRQVRMPAGATTRATFEQVTPLVKPVRATITFNEQGVVGQIATGDLGPLSNMLLATPAGTMQARAQGETGFIATPADMQSPGQYAGTGVIDDAQRRRLQVLRTLLGGEPETADPGVGGAPLSIPGRQRTLPFPEVPSLLGWADAMALGFVVPQAKERIGSALVSIPLSIERPAAGTKVTVPAAFMPYRILRGKYGPTPAIYVEEQRSWNKSSIPGTLPIAFRVPTQLLPLRVERAKFTFSISAPGATVEILVDREGHLVSLERRQSPDGVIELDLPVDRAQPDDQGQIVVVARISYTQPGDRPLWQVRGTSLEVRGTVEE